MKTSFQSKRLFSVAMKSLRRFPGTLFLAELCKHPGAVGAIWPSSKSLACAIARQVPNHGEGLIVELGAGTGSVTAALLDSGIPPERLLVVERSASFVRHLRLHYPSIQIVQGDATQLDAFIPENAVVDAIVSSLPLRSLNPIEVADVVDQWHGVLKPGGIVIQFTYNLRCLIKQSMNGFSEQAKCFVWRNIPPARVSRLARYSQS